MSATNKKLLEDIQALEASFIVAQKRLNEIKKQLGEPAPRRSNKVSEKQVMIQRMLANKERSRMKYYSQ